VEYAKASDEFREKFKVACKRMGIEVSAMNRVIFCCIVEISSWFLYIYT